MADPGTMLGMKAIGWVTAPIISELFKKCANYLSFHASEKLRQLGPKVLLLERAMEVFVEFPNRSRVEQLFNDLKNAFYEAEDILDDIEYHCLEKKIQDDKFISDGSVSLHKRCWLKKLLPKGSVLKNKATGMSKKDLKESLEKIDEIINNAYKFVEHLNLSTMIKFNGNQAAPASSEGAVTTGAPPPIVFGRDKERDKIMEMLHEKEGDDQPNTNGGLCYSVIGIHGIGGSGKSTLAQLVYAREKDQQGKKDDHFDLVMWVHVSQNFSVGDIFKEIFEAATGNSCPQLNNLNTLQDKLEEKLHGKRFLLVLDDVWSNIRDERQHWNLRQIISPLKAGEAGSRILVTSRTEDALLVLGATKLRCVPISDLDNDVFLSLLMYYALEGAILDDHVRRRLNVVGADIAKKLKGSPLSARIVGRRLGMRPDAEFWRTVRNEKFVGGTMGALWWSYKHLDQHARRCFAYCSIFPRKHHLQCDELVELWVAEGFISTNEGEEMEDVGREYFYELVSTSFLQPGGKDENGKDYFVIHDLLHDLAGMVAGNDCFRIENGSGLGKEVWTGEVPRDVRHLYIHRYTGAFMTRNILELKILRTLMIYNAGWGLAIEEVIEIIFKGLLKLRVLTINLPLVLLSVPESVCQLKHLRYLSFRTETSSLVILPSTLTKLYHIQLLHFGGGVSLDSSSASLTNLLHLSFYSGPDILNIGRLTSLQTIPSFRVRKEPGFEVKQLRDLDKLRGSLCINGLENVESNEQAVEANLSAKERLTELTLNWDGDSSCPEVEAEVLEGLCPPIWLETLCLSYYKGSRYPNWMVDNQSGGPKDLQELEFWECSQLGPAPKLEGFIHLRSLWLWGCSWDSLPSNMENLVLLKKLMVDHCFNILWLPTLPQSLEVFNLVHCNEEFMQSCETIGHPNWQKIEHVPKRNINDPVDQDKVIRAYNRMTYRKYYGVGPE